MLELLVVCQLMSDDNKTLIKEAKVLDNKRLICDSGIRCRDALLVQFIGDIKAAVVAENDCLYVRSKSEEK